jgi:hypothetical protein
MRLKAGREMLNFRKKDASGKGMKKSAYKPLMDTNRLK